MNPPVSADVHSNSIKASEMECDVASQSGSGVLMMMENYPAEISDDEFSPRSRVEHNPIDESEGGEMRATSAVSTGSSSASSSQSKNRNRSESASRSDTTDNTTGMKDWGWFDDMHDINGVSNQMSDVNERDENKLKMKGNNLDDGQTTSSFGVGSDMPKNSRLDEDSKMNDVNDTDTTSSRNGEKRKGKKKKKKTMLELEFDQLDGPIDGMVNTPKKDEHTSMMAVTAPMYVLEESQSCQTLWRETAGTRPPQPIEERLFYESMWVKNFERSQVKYHMPTDVLTATTPISLSPFADGNFANVSNTSDGQHQDGSYGVSTNVKYSNGSGGALSDGYGARRSNSGGFLGPYDHHHTVVNKTVKDNETGDNLTVLVKGDNVFGTTVSKSFLPNGNIPGPVESVSISVGSYRVVESKKHGKYAQFLVIFCTGEFRNTVGVWKRYSDFNKLSRKVTRGSENCTSVLAGMGPLSVTEETPEMMPNAMTSWSLVKKRKRWYRCLDAGYLSIKIFLLERFLHDILYESTSPDILRDFVGFAE